MQDNAVAREIIIQILTQDGPQSGARLKQGLNFQLKKIGLDHFDESQLGFKRFRSYLEKALSDIVRVIPAEDFGDISVSLLSDPVDLVQEQDAGDPPLDISLIKDDIRLSFTNPDSSRKRFFNKLNHAVKHYSMDGESKEKSEVSSHAEDYVEIHPVSAQVQKLWMSEFIEKHKHQINDPQILERIIEKNYNSALNAEFGKALGELSGVWKRFRNSNIAKAIRQWAVETKIDESLLLKTNSSQGSLLKTSPADEGGIAEGLGVRSKAVKLLDLLSDEDISRFVIPTLMGVIMVKSHK